MSNEFSYDAILRDLNRAEPGRFTHVKYKLGWLVRDDGDIETADGVVPLEDFAAAGRIDSVHLEMAREIKRAHLANLAKDAE